MNPITHARTLSRSESLLLSSRLAVWQMWRAWFKDVGFWVAAEELQVGFRDSWVYGLSFDSSPCETSAQNPTSSTLLHLLVADPKPLLKQDAHSSFLMAAENDPRAGGWLGSPSARWRFRLQGFGFGVLRVSVFGVLGFWVFRIWVFGV